MKRLLEFIKSFLKKWGIFGLLAVVTLYIPVWLGLIIQSDKLISFGWKWAAIWALPIPPAWLAIGLIAGFYKAVYYTIKKYIVGDKT